MGGDGLRYGMSFHRVGAPEGIVSELVYVQELWRKRAEVAQECADELGELAAALGSVIRTNYFGTGCVEGEGLFHSLQILVRDGVQSLNGQADSAAGLAETATAAELRLREADDVAIRHVS
ncbi:hypothetical protein ACN95_09700 [Gordonia sihwensis]|nr:hypothetical protein UG54_04850 [Gordonia sihwensis]MBY4570291.1 hypothetical protein [Gordonia sihwensis]